MATTRAVGGSGPTWHRPTPLGVKLKSRVSRVPRVSPFLVVLRAYRCPRLTHLRQCRVTTPLPKSQAWRGKIDALINQAAGMVSRGRFATPFELALARRMRSRPGRATQIGA